MSDVKPDPIFQRTFPASYRKGDQKRFEILQTTMEVLAKDGIDGLSFDRIAKNLGTRRSHVIYYFHTKEELLLGVLKYITATAQELTIEAVSRAKTPKERVLAIGEGAIAWSERHPEQTRAMILMYFVFSYEPGFKTLHTQIRTAGLQRLQSLLEAIFSDRPEAGPSLPALARALQSVLTGLLIERETINGVENVDYRQAFSVLLERLIGP